MEIEKGFIIVIFSIIKRESKIEMREKEIFI